MGIAERKEREKTEMRDLILQAATELFVERGYDDTSIRTIAEKIEYSPATIYLYFKDKPELFHAMMDHAFSLLIEKFSIVDKTAHPIEQLRQLGQVYMKYALENPALYDLMFIMRKPMDHVACAEDWDCGMQAYHFLYSIIETCMQQELVRFTDAHVGAITVWSHLHGLIALNLRGRFVMIPEEMHAPLIQASVDSLIEIIQK